MLSIQASSARRVPEQTAPHSFADTSASRHASTPTADNRQRSGPLCGLLKCITPRRRPSTPPVQSDATHQPPIAELTVPASSASTPKAHHTATRSARSSKEHARQAAFASLQAKKEDCDRIETTSRTLMALVMDGRNPFVEGAPYYNNQEEEQAGTSVTLNDIPSLKKLFWESREPKFFSGMEYMYGEMPEPPCCDLLSCDGGYSVRHEQWQTDMSAHLGTGEVSSIDGSFSSHHQCSDTINMENLSKAVETWRTRELIVHALPECREQFEEIPLYLPEHTREQIKSG